MENRANRDGKRNCEIQRGHGGALHRLFRSRGDPAGDFYWLNQLNSGQISETGMAASFSVQPEAAALYAFLTSPSTASQAQITSFIGSVYEDLFNREPEPSGLAYWEHQLAANLGNPQAVGDFILAVIFGAQGLDQTTISNKVTVAEYFTQELNSTGSSFTSSTNSLVPRLHQSLRIRRPYWLPSRQSTPG